MKIYLFNSLFLLLALTFFSSCSKDSILDEKISVTAEDQMESRRTDERDCTAVISNIAAWDNNWTIRVYESICGNPSSTLIKTFTPSNINNTGTIPFGVFHDRHYEIVAYLTPNTNMTFDFTHNNAPVTNVVIDHFFNVYSFQSDCGLVWLNC